MHLQKIQEVYVSLFSCFNANFILYRWHFYFNGVRQSVVHGQWWQQSYEIIRDGTRCSVHWRTFNAQCLKYSEMISSQMIVQLSNYSQRQFTTTAGVVLPGDKPILEASS